MPNNATRCESMTVSLGPANAELRETMREDAAQWRRLAADAEARAVNLKRLGDAVRAAIVAERRATR
jgi:hypothetical protein